MAALSTQEPIDVELGFISDKADFLRLLDYCVPDAKGDKYTKAEDKKGITVVRLNPLYIREANVLFRKYRFPQIDPLKVESARVEVETKPKEESAVEVFIRPTMKMLVVYVNSIRHELGYEMVDTFWGIIKEQGDLNSRQMWFNLIERHGLFPELKEIDRMLVDSMQAGLTTRERGMALREWLSDHKTDFFEGSRRSSRDDTKGRSYYETYHSPMLILAKLGLVEYTGVGSRMKITLSDDGRDAEGWLPFALAKLKEEATW